ncbi:hypothetical protein SAMN05421540_101242 [Psychroflexus halocasei]|uniref:Uncharacterized protein n=1 Tax=Psychroflexus halocasei TaxID=908615 RepID=A0A1H3VT85_9FLAO|nr:hypothetical protein SAMN05421540_101242 [Psychroflexus halocasei]
MKCILSSTTAKSNFLFYIIPFSWMDFEIVLGDFKNEYFIKLIYMVNKIFSQKVKKKLHMRLIF